jgi:hypothetical protein
VGKSKHRITNWPEYNRALLSRGSLIFWIDEQAIKQWCCTEHHGGRGRCFQYSDTAIETALMLKGLFNLPLRALEGFINSVFSLMNVPLSSPDYSCISKHLLLGLRSSTQVQSVALTGRDNMATHYCW